MCETSDQCFRTGVFGKPAEVTTWPLCRVVRRASCLGPSELGGEKILFSGLFDGFSVLVECLNWRKE